MKQVLAGEKDLLHRSDVNEISVPQYEELSVKALYPQFAKDAKFMSLFPDKYPKGKGPPRDYFFNVLNTLHPEYLQNVMNHANKQRHTSEGEAM